MRRARFTLEEQVGGLIDEEHYELRRPEATPGPDWPARTEPTSRPLSIRADAA
jgi:hypothetical protein